MCGLPGSGKTNWVKEQIKGNTDRRYTVIGNSSLLERMTVSLLQNIIIECVLYIILLLFRFPAVL